MEGLENHSKYAHGHWTSIWILFGKSLWYLISKSSKENSRRIGRCKFTCRWNNFFCQDSSIIRKWVSVLTPYDPLWPHVTTRTIIFRDGESKNYYDKTHIAYLLQLKQALYYGNYACFNLLFELGLSCATLWYGGHLIIAGRMDGESLIPFVLYQLSLGDSLQGMGAVYTGSVSV